MSNIFPKKPNRLQSFKGKIWMDFIPKQIYTSNQTCTASQFFFTKKRNRHHKRCLFMLLHRPKREKYNLTTSIGSQTTSKFALFRKQKVNSERLHIQQKVKKRASTVLQTGHALKWAPSVGLLRLILVVEIRQ